VALLIAGFAALLCSSRHREMIEQAFKFAQLGSPLLHHTRLLHLRHFFTVVQAAKPSKQ
jgi:hypothetical protein